MSESPSNTYNHLKIHTQYSICEGAIKIDDLQNFSKLNKIQSLGLCDTTNLCGALEFAEKISKIGTQPIIGTQINFKYGDTTGLLPLFSLNEKGYKRIIKLSSLSYLENDNLSIRITITRGNSERGRDILPNSNAFLLITSSKIKNNLRMKPLKLSISNILRNETSITSKYKTTNYLDNIIAKHEAIKSKFDDVLFINAKNYICCSSTSNFFYREDKKIFTPPIQDGVLDGTIREILIAKRKVAVKSIKLNSLKNCKEVFITNSLFGIRPVEKIEKFNFNIGQDTYDIDKFLSNLGM